MKTAASITPAARSAIPKERLGAKRPDRKKVRANNGATRILSTAKADHA